MGEPILSTLMTSNLYVSMRLTKPSSLDTTAARRSLCKFMQLILAWCTTTLYLYMSFLGTWVFIATAALLMYSHTIISPDIVPETKIWSYSLPPRAVTVSLCLLCISNYSVIMSYFKILPPQRPPKKRC